MNPKQNKAILLMVEGELTQKQIAKELNVSVQSIITWRKKSEFQEALVIAEREKLKGLSIKAIKTMENLLNAKSELVRYNAASDILDRTGHKPIEKQEVTQRNIEINVGEFNDED